MKKILITGCGGFVGSHLAEAELKQGNLVTGIDLNSEKISHINNPNFSFIQANVLNKNIMKELIAKNDLIYHFAAIANVQDYCDDPIRVLDTNIDSLRIVASLAHLYKKKVVFSSSSEVYGKSMAVPFKESDDSLLGSTQKARWCYSASKIVGEQYLYGYVYRGLKMAICRFFNFYGPRLDLLGHGRVIPCFLEKFLKNEPVEVVEPGDQTRSFTYIDDGIDGIIRVAHMKEAEGQIFNIGTTDEISVLELATLMKSVGQFSSKIIMVSADKIYHAGRHEEIFRRVPNTTKIQKLLGWEPKVNLEDGLKKTIDWFKKYYRKQKE